jgi:hypothetical protein
VFARLVPTAFAVALVTGCGSPTQHAATTTSPGTTRVTTTVPAATQSTSSTPGALQGEAAQAAAGDIPDNQVFVAYRGGAFTMKVPEGWTRTGGARSVVFRDKNNIVRVVVATGAQPTVGSVRRELASLPGVHVQSPPERVTIGGTPAVKAVYSTASGPNPVTGKRVTLVVDHYELGRTGKRAVVDLGTPEGVDNVDAYRLMIESFRVR